MLKNIATFIVFLLLFAGCADKVNVTLLPEEGGRVGVIEFVDNSGKEHLISKAWETLEIDKSGKADSKISDEKTVMKKYGDTIAAMPPKPASFMIFFGSESFDISSESKKELELAIEEIKNKKASLVMCAGHTDSLGEKEYNRALSLRRANSVVKYLIAHGVDKNIIEARHYGDANPLVKTASGASPKNRRVEIIVK
jgi:outer membrane protein OmpA-like peptidoglycan-associated protein